MADIDNKPIFGPDGFNLISYKYELEKPRGLVFKINHLVHSSQEQTIRYVNGISYLCGNIATES